MLTESIKNVVSTMIYVAFRSQSVKPHFKHLKCTHIKHFFFLKDSTFLERMEGKEKQRERKFNWQKIHGWVASGMPVTGDLACNPGICPD